MFTSSSPALRPLAALAATGALALSGCGGDDEPQAKTYPGATVTATGAGVVDADGRTIARPATSGGAAGGGSEAGGGTSGGGTSKGGAAGSDSAGGGDEEAYVRTLEGICKTVAKDSQTFVSEISQLGASAADPRSIAPLKGPMKRFFDAVGRSYRQLAAAQAPDRWASYQASLRSDAAGVAKYLDEAKGLLDDADSPGDLQGLQALMGRTNFNTGDAPKDLATRTPSCSRAGAAGAADARTVTTPAP